MQKNHIGKILAVGIIIVLVWVSVVSSAVEVNKNVDDELRENYNLEPLNSSREIITYFIVGGMSGSITKEISGNGFFFRHVELWAEESIKIIGFRRFLIFPIIFDASAHHLIAPCCLIIWNGPLYPGAERFSAIALGDIEWS